MATINNVSYSWSMFRLCAEKLTGDKIDNSITLLGVTGFKWNRRQKIENNYGLGGKVIGRGFGNWECTASITMDYATQQQLRALNGGLMNIGQFDIIASFSNSDASTTEGINDYVTETITCKGCFFNEDGMEVSQDDTNITKEFDLNPFWIEVGNDTSASVGLITSGNVEITTNTNGEQETEQTGN